MKRLTLVLTALLAIGLAAPAFAEKPEGAPPGPPKGPRPMHKMALLPPRVEKELNLTADQQTKVAELNAAFEKERDAWMEANKPDPQLREDMQKAREAGDKEKMKELGGKMRQHGKPVMEMRKKYTDQVRAILTDEQKAKLDQAIEDGKKRMEEGRKNREGGGDKKKD